MSVFVRGVGNVTITRGLHRGSHSVVVMFIAADPSFVVRTFSIRTFRCVAGPCGTRRVCGMLSSTSSCMSSGSGCVRIVYSHQGALVSLGRVISIRSSTRCVGVNIISKLECHAQVAVTRFLGLTSGSAHFVPMGEKVILGTSCVGSVRNSMYIANGNREFPVGVHRGAQVRRDVHRCVFGGVERGRQE